MFEILPLEVVERILSYLNKNDLVATFVALDRQYNILPDYFWKNVCLRDNFLKCHPNQAWYECFEVGMNKRLGNYTQISNNLSEKLQHVYYKSIITQSKCGDFNLYSIYTLDCKNKFNLVQILQCDIVQFREELILIHMHNAIFLYVYNYITNIYEQYKSLPEFTFQVLGFDKKYCVSYDSNQRCFNLYTLHNNCIYHNIKLPSDVKLLLPVKNILHSEEIVVPVLSFEETYKIKVYDIKSCSWILDLVCFASTGITNEPNIWVGSDLIGCCDVSYRSRGIYFGIFKIWNRQGDLLFQEDIQPSNKHYLRCLFKSSFVLLTTSDNSLSIGDISGVWFSKLKTSTSFIDIKLSSGNLLFVLLEDKKTVEMYDWLMHVPLYIIKLQNQFCMSICSEWLYCTHNPHDGTSEIISFFTTKTIYRKAITIGSEQK